MPYIKEADREDLRILADRAADRVKSPGEMNYFISRFLHQALSPGYPHYKKFNAVIGVLECCKLELYRRLLVPYEDKKMEENGDIV